MLAETRIHRWSGSLTTILKFRLRLVTASAIPRNSSDEEDATTCTQHPAGATQPRGGGGTYQRFEVLPAILCKSGMKNRQSASGQQVRYPSSYLERCRAALPSSVDLLCALLNNGFLLRGCHIAHPHQRPAVIFGRVYKDHPAFRPSSALSNRSHDSRGEGRIGQQTKRWVRARPVNIGLRLLVRQQKSSTFRAKARSSNRKKTHVVFHLKQPDHVRAGILRSNA